jgi:hypothetical protein
VRWRVDSITGACAAAVGAFALWQATGLSMFVKGVPGPGLFPLLVSSVLLLLGLMLFVQGVRQRPRATVGQVPDSPDSAPERLIDPADLRRPAVVLVGYAATVPLLTLIGFVPASVVLIGYVLLVVDRRRGWAPLLAVVAIPIATFELFAHALDLRLPVGPLGF